jgi:hypothetical protein
MPAVLFQNRLVLPSLLALAILIMAVVQPLAGLAAAGMLCFLLAYFFRRDWLLGGIFVVLIFQNLAYKHLLRINEPLASLVKHADDYLIVFFVVALAAEVCFPAIRLNRAPHWRLFAVLLFVCLLAAARNHSTPKACGLGTYVLLKNFVWFYLAASIRLDDRGYRNVLRFLFIVLGAILVFGAVQFATGDLTYDLLGLPKDYRFGIPRLHSIFVHPVFLAEAMALLAVLAVSAYVHLRKPVYLALALGGLVAVGLTMLVKTIAALGLAVGFVLLRKRPWLIVPYAILALIAMLSFSEYGAENVRRQYAMYIESPQSVRREGYRIAGEILRDSPLFGVGPGMFGGFAATLLESPIPVRYGFINYDQLDYSTVDAHWPHLVAEIGLIGLVVYGWLLWAMGRASWRLPSRARISPHARTMALAAAVLLLVAVIEAFAAANFEDTFTGFMIFSMLGLTQGNYLAARNETDNGRLTTDNQQPTTNNQPPA